MRKAKKKGGGGGWVGGSVRYLAELAHGEVVGPDAVCGFWGGGGKGIFACEWWVEGESCGLVARGGVLSLSLRASYVPDFHCNPKEEEDVHVRVVFTALTRPVVAAVVDQLIARKGHEERPDVDEAARPTVCPLVLVLWEGACVDGWGRMTQM